MHIHLVRTKFTYVTDGRMYRHADANKRFTWHSEPLRGWTVRGSKSGGGEIFLTCPDNPRGPPNFLHKENCVIPVDEGVGTRRQKPTPIYRRGYRKSEAIPLFLTGHSCPVIGRT